MVNMLKNTGLLLGSLLVCVVITELGLRLTSIGIYSQNYRVLMYSIPSFTQTSRYAIRYKPNIAIRTVAVYGDQIDYDVTNTTNNLGQYDNVPYQKTADSIRDIVFVGDSFTSGSGGTKPWVTTLREQLNRSDIALYNLGVSATSVQHFYYMLKEFEKEIPFDEVNECLHFGWRSMIGVHRIDSPLLRIRVVG